jgi:hypothetical protein
MLSLSLATMKGIWVFVHSARYFFPDLSKFGVFRQILIKAPNTKFHGNPSKVAALMHADRWTDMTKLLGFVLYVWQRA